MYHFQNILWSTQKIWEGQRGLGILGLGLFPGKPPGFREHGKKWESGINIFNHEVGNALFCIMGTLRITDPLSLPQKSTNKNFTWQQYEEDIFLQCYMVFLNCFVVFTNDRVNQIHSIRYTTQGDPTTPRQKCIQGP